MQETAQRTQQALSVILDGKVNSSKPTHIPEQCDPNQQKATFVRYTPNPNAPGVYRYCCSAHREARGPAGRPHGAAQAQAHEGSPRAA